MAYCRGCMRWRDMETGQPRCLECRNREAEAQRLEREAEEVRWQAASAQAAWAVPAAPIPDESLLSDTFSAVADALSDWGDSDTDSYDGGGGESGGGGSSDSF